MNCALFTNCTISNVCQYLTFILFFGFMITDPPVKFPIKKGVTNTLFDTKFLNAFPIGGNKWHVIITFYERKSNEKTNMLSRC